MIFDWFDQPRNDEDPQTITQLSHFEDLFSSDQFLGADFSLTSFQKHFYPDYHPTINNSNNNNKRGERILLREESSKLFLCTNIKEELEADSIVTVMNNGENYDLWARQLYYNPHFSETVWNYFGEKPIHQLMGFLFRPLPSIRVNAISRIQHQHEHHQEHNSDSNNNNNNMDNSKRKNQQPPLSQKNCAIGLDIRRNSKEKEKIPRYDDDFVTCGIHSGSHRDEEGRETGDTYHRDNGTSYWFVATDSLTTIQWSKDIRALGVEAVTTSPESADCNNPNNSVGSSCMQSALEDMWLLSQCEHLVITERSSFGR